MQLCSVSKLLNIVDAFPQVTEQFCWLGSDPQPVEKRKRVYSLYAPTVCGAIFEPEPNGSRASWRLKVDLVILRVLLVMGLSWNVNEEGIPRHRGRQKTNEAITPLAMMVELIA